MTRKTKHSSSLSPDRIAPAQTTIRNSFAKNLDRLEHFALQVYHGGTHSHDWGVGFALPLMKQAGSRSLSDPIAAQYLYPVASRLIDRCDAVFRIEGESKGAEEDVRLARQRGLPVYQRIEEIPVRREMASMTA